MFEYTHTQAFEPTGSNKVQYVLQKEFIIPVDHRLRVNGKMANDTDSALRRVVVGCTGANGHKATKVATECDKAPHQPPNMKEPGQMVYKMATAPKRMPMEVSTGKKLEVLF